MRTTDIRVDKHRMLNTDDLWSDCSADILFHLTIVHSGLHTHTQAHSLWILPPPCLLLTSYILLPILSTGLPNYTHVETYRTRHYSRGPIRNITSIQHLDLPCWRAICSNACTYTHIHTNTHIYYVP